MYVSEGRKIRIVHIILPALLLLLSNITNAQIVVNIKVSDLNEVTVHASGQSVKTDLKNANHKEVFHITDELLQKALFTFTGLQTEVFLDDDSDIYSNYKLEPVKAFLKPNGTKILNVTKEEVVLNKLQAFNHDAFEKTQIITLEGSVEDNVTCVFKQKDVFPAEVAHTIDVDNLDVWSIKSSFGRDLSETRTIPIAHASLTVHLGPNQDATAILSATKLTVLIQINYLAILTGSLIAKFDSAYIWGYEHYDIKTIMDEAGMPHSVRLIEEITVEFYTNCTITLYGDNIYATNNVNQCFFTVINGTNGKDINWRAAKHTILAANALPKVLNSRGNGATKISETILLVVSLFMLIQRL